MVDTVQSIRYMDNMRDSYSPEEAVLIGRRIGELLTERAKQMASGPRSRADLTTALNTDVKTLTQYLGTKAGGVDKRARRLPLDGDAKVTVTKVAEALDRPDAACKLSDLLTYVDRP